MNNRKRNIIALLALTLCIALLCGLLAACGMTNKAGESSTLPPSSSPAAVEGELSVRVYQPDTAQEPLWQALAADYKSLTGVTIALEKPPEATVPLEHLKERLKAEKPPAVILFTNPSEHAAWKENAADLAGTEAYKRLLDPLLALHADGKPVAVPLGVQAFGVVYNKPILEAYFALPGKATAFTKADDVTDFAKLEALVKDITKNKTELGIDGVFAAAALKEGESAAVSHRLLSLPLSYEFRKANTELTGTAINEISFRYAEPYHAFVDLLLANATAAPNALDARTQEAAAAEFTDGKAAMLLGGTELWGKLNTAAAQTLRAEDIGILPAFMQFTEGERTGLALEPQLYAAINAKGSNEERLAAEAFLEWLVSSDRGLDFLGRQLNLLAPYSTLTEALLPSNPLSADAFRQLKAGDATVIHLVSATALSPGEEFREKTVGMGLASYAKGESAWDDFKSSVSTKWKEFREKLTF
ncbi:MAG: ABC transporter substrate-binding protein [Oscillospiraceae bacterium]|jgi:raffinose/stachyose/melibiose transport system substrate-binding protein|nr:ABC transporter substrate-binding protein [Oscillospiraceae bacterium]